MSLYVQYGAGLCGPRGWSNYDASPSLWLQRIPVCGFVFRGVGPAFPSTVQYGDIVKGLPVAPRTCDAIYCSHILEHLSRGDCSTALRNTFSYLKPGGRFRLCLPDLEQLAQDYLANGAATAASVFMEDSYLGMHSRPRGLVGLLRQFLGNSKHLWMWDYKSMEQELATAGFVQVRRAAPGDSNDSHFDEVEDPSRWRNNLGIECFRPA